MFIQTLLVMQHSNTFLSIESSTAKPVGFIAINTSL